MSLDSNISRLALLTQFTRRRCFGLLLLLCGIAAFGSNPAFGQEKITYQDHVKPIFKQRCARCHNPNRESGGLDLTNFTNMMQGGSSGSSIEPGDAGGSYLFALVTHEDEPAMPPGNNKIPENEIQLLADWINGGALETKTSVARITKPKIDMAVGDNPNVRPEIAPVPPRLSKEPVIHTARPSNATTIATSPWAPIAAIGMAQQVLLYDIAEMKLIGVLPFPEGTVHQLRFSRNGSVLIAGGGKDGASGVVVGWDVPTGERVFSVGDELDAVLAADISADHAQIALGGPARMVKVFSTQDGTLLYEIEKHTDWVTAIEFSPNGKFLATADRNGGFHVWESDSGEEYLTLKGHSEQVTAVSWRVDGKMIASASEDGTARVWETENGKQLKSWPAHEEGATDVVFNRDGQILTSGRDQKVKLWQQDGKPIHEFAGLEDIAIACAYSDEAQRVIGSDWSGMLRAWKALDAKQVGKLDTNPAPIKTRIEQAKQYLQAANAKTAQLRKNHQRMAANLKAKVDAIAKKTTSENRLQQKLTALRNELANLNRRVNEINATKTNAPKEKLEAQLAAELVSLRRKHTELKTTITDNEANLRQIITRLNELQVSQIALTPKVAIQEANLNAAIANQKKAKAAIRYWQSEQQFAAELESLYAEIAAAETEFARSAEQAAEKKQAFQQAEAAQAAVRKKLESVQQKIRDARSKSVQ